MKPLYFLPFALLALMAFCKPDNIIEKIKGTLLKDEYKTAGMLGYKRKNITIDSIFFVITGMGAWYAQKACSIRKDIGFVDSLYLPMHHISDTGRIQRANKLKIWYAGYASYVDSLAAAAAGSDLNSLYKVWYRVSMRQGEEVVNRRDSVFLYRNTFKRFDIDLGNAYYKIHPLGVSLTGLVDRYN